MNKRPHPAIHKILKSHPDFDMEPFFQLKLKLIPVVVNWFQSARSRMLANDLGESIQRQSLQSRELSALYKFRLHGKDSEVDQEEKEAAISLVVRNAGGKSDSNCEVVSILQVRKRLNIWAA
ncbi:hypothetical protein QTG54_015230 [Skeletonema marinoi]|uniref:Uncharacterized protein n=1 Tax=Skeletonema marinoi TaxID=267567 RepID=A0AAD8XUX7_9STRA|nr:hypothetical protein QTG54_015230 [Skeletonema marinoi]